ncbi:MAG TPA: two-component regulator propeller domain-containing protein [Candidatus Acidoferrum sp.]|nr:two-component regulator propeller domain-containing protein [Candidatus Acidoferrum sp.]
MRASMPIFAPAQTAGIRRLAAGGLLLALLALGPSVPGAGPADDYSTDVWTSENGLPDSSVTAIAQTPDGYLWIGTYNGLARFDGVRFVTFDPANTPELTHARIRKLFLDSQGTLWINTLDGSLTTVRHGTFALERRNPRSSEAEMTLVSSSSNRVIFLTSRGGLFRKSLNAPAGAGWEELTPPSRGTAALACEDGQGRLWYRDSNRQLWRFINDRFERLPEDAGLTDAGVDCLLTDPPGRLWAATDREIAVWDGAHFQNHTPTNLASPLGITLLAATSDGHIWLVANGDAGLAVDGCCRLQPEAARGFFKGNPGRIGVLEDHRGGMWFYSFGRGLAHADAAGQFQQLTSRDGFPGDRVNCFFEDHEGNWWAGLEAQGLVRLRERQFHTMTAGDATPAPAAKSVCQDSNGTVWIGTLSAGLDGWHGGDYTNLAVVEEALPASVFCVCPDSLGRLWVSAGDEDLYLGEKGKFTRVSPVVHGVKAILAGRTGRVWFGTTSGLFFADPQSPNEIQPFKGITHRNVRAISEDQSGTLWAGTGSGELHAIAGDTTTVFRPTDDQESGAIWSLLADQDGTVWVGTFRGGLLRFRNGQFTRFSKKDGLPDNVICQILDDGRGNLWLGSHQGIFRIAKSALNDLAQGKGQGGFISSVAYGRSDGLPSLECSGGYQPAAWAGQDGRLWFTTAKGATWIQPEQLHPNPIPPPVVIEEVLVDGQAKSLAVPDDADAARSDTGIPRLEVPPGKHQFEFRYTGLSLVSSDRIQFRYRLEGADADWVQAGTRRFAHYNILPPGDYRFQVIAGNSDSVWNTTGRTLAVKILPHLYETWWFRLLAGLVILTAVAGTVRYTATRQLHRKMEQLERQRAVERERARIAKDIHDDLGANLTLIAVLGDLAKKERAEERIEKMSRTARQAVKSLDEIVWAVNPRNDTLAHLIDYTAQFTTDYLRDGGIRCLLDVPEQISPREVPANVRHNVFLAVKEALQNIVKHARATEVWLRISTIPSGLRLIIEDNGCGFAGPSPDAWADGLGNMRQRLTEIGGECRVQSRIGAGTVITIEFPWPHGESPGSYLHPITGEKNPP